MFKNYYAILNISEKASAAEIKSAFKRQAVLWHPDKNPGRDTTIHMQDIIEAKLILLDIDARNKYDIEFQIFRENFHEETAEETYNNSSSERSNHFNYDVKDEILSRWMNSARRQSAEYLKQTIEDFKGMVVEGGKAGLKKSGEQIVIQITIAIIGFLIFSIAKSCN